MSRTQRIVLIIAGVIALIGAGFLIWSLVSGDEEETQTQETAEVPEIVNVNQEVEEVVEETDELVLSEIPLETQLKRLARNFTERYGSFSNQNDYENLENLANFMTASLQNETETFIAKERKKEVDTTNYYGISTQVLSVETESFDEEGGTMSVLLTVRRAETDTAARTNESYEQDVRLTYKKEGDRWLVDSITFIDG